MLFLRPSSWVNALIERTDRRVCGVVTTDTFPCEITPNPDIAGIGGRIALYIQAFTLPIIFVFFRTDANAARWALTTTAIGLDISAIISSVTYQITPYHIFLVSKFQGLLLLFVAFVEPNSPRSRGPHLQLVSKFRWVLATAIRFWYAITAPCFGGQPACNAYVRESEFKLLTSALEVQGWHVPPSLRYWFSSLISSRGQTTSWLLEPYFRSTPDGVGSTDSGAAYFRSSITRGQPRSPYFSSRHSISTVQLRVAEIIRDFKLRSYSLFVDVWTALHTPKLQRFALALPFAVVQVWDIEHTITSNTVGPGENAWTYGQILAVLLAVIPVVQVLQLCGILVGTPE
ncbi:hypothetical protein JAAARDRAFT_191638 [Jaapia argillacea MUCL 33604]|uniref:Uncharacterized protein n=1 Tax=Jaapia argillacea MUCL 33604 TaxID=933084 RepID=A0A067QCB2_9AGAM|nr:hypothetical protein JAAARDRAFT_191638 [Jaapia argillacea MUCL 33604]